MNICIIFKQAHAVCEKANQPVSEEDWALWAARLEAITDEHREEGAREQLAAGWKVWLVAVCPSWQWHRTGSSWSPV